MKGTTTNTENGTSRKISATVRRNCSGNEKITNSKTHHNHCDTDYLLQLASCQRSASHGLPQQPEGDLGIQPEQPKTSDSV